MTIDAAWQLGVENDLGSLVPGKIADLVLLSANPLEVPAEELPEIEVLGTWIDGRPVDARRWTWQNVKLGIGALVGLIM